MSFRGEIVVYGAEGVEGRGLFVIAALHLCARWLHELAIPVRFIAVDTIEVRAGLEALRFRSGLEAAVEPTRPELEPRVAFRNAALYVGVVSTDPSLMALGQAARRRIPTIGAVQFPADKDLTPAILENMRCAFDSRALAEKIQAHVRRCLSLESRA